MKWKKREDFFARKKKKSERNRRGRGVQGNRSSRGSMRRSSPAVAGAEAAIAGSKAVERESG
jgi:hypothetical protein